MLNLSTFSRRYDPAADTWINTGMTFQGTYMHVMTYNDH